MANDEKQFVQTFFVNKFPYIEHCKDFLLIKKDSNLSNKYSYCLYALLSDKNLLAT